MPLNPRHMLEDYVGLKPNQVPYLNLCVDCDCVVMHVLTKGKPPDQQERCQRCERNRKRRLATQARRIG